MQSSVYCALFCFVWAQEEEVIELKCMFVGGSDIFFLTPLNSPLVCGGVVHSHT